MVNNFQTPLNLGKNVSSLKVSTLLNIQLSYSIIYLLKRNNPIFFYFSSFFFTICFFLFCLMWHLFLWRETKSIPFIPTHPDRREGQMNKINKLLDTDANRLVSCTQGHEDLGYFDHKHEHTLIPTDTDRHSHTHSHRHSQTHNNSQTWPWVWYIFE